MRDIELIMKRLVAYENAMVRDSIFDSIANGTFNLETFVEETLKDAENERNNSTAD